MSNAVFLRHPVGVRITTETVITEEDFAYDVLTVENDRGQTILIPTDNIASVEIGR